MTYILLFSIFISSTIFLSCSKDNDGGIRNELANFTSGLTDKVSGPTAAYWAYANGIALPLSQIPTLTNPGSQFTHSQLPYLGFQMPQGYTGTQIYDQRTGTIGVDVIRNDNAVVWRYIPTSSYPGNFTLNDIIGSQINGMFNFYGFNGDFEVLDTETKTVSQSGISTTFSGRLLRFGNITAVVWVNVTVVQGLSNYFVTSSVSSAPTNEFDDIVVSAFLPISFQLLVADRDTLSDRDRDGTPDIYDSQPDNPNVQ